MKRKNALGAVAVAVTLTLAACSSGSETAVESVAPAASQAPAEAASSQAAAPSEAPVDPLAEAKSYLDTRVTNPTSIGIDVPLSKTPEAGKLIVRLLTPAAIQERISAGNEEAAKALGWEYKAIPVSGEADGIQKAFQAALDLKPDGIAYGGYPAVMLTEQLQAAVDAGIFVVPDSTADIPGSVPGIDVMLDGIPEQLAWGKDLAAFVVGDSNGAANVAVFNVSAFPILEPVVTSFTKNLTAWCPTCKVQVVDQTLADIGTKTPQSVVSTLQRDPSINYILFTFGDLATGVAAAVETAGITDQAKVIGSAISQAGLQGVRDGKDAAWVGLPPDILGWRSVDAFARMINGDSLDPANSALLPSQIITQANVKGIVVDEADFYNAVADYKEQFKKLWLVK